MSFYQRHSFTISNHAIARAKERIKSLKDKDDFFIRNWINQQLQIVTKPEFESNEHSFYPIPNEFSMYIVVVKNKNLVLSVRKVSHGRRLGIM